MRTFKGQAAASAFPTSTRPTALHTAHAQVLTASNFFGNGGLAHYVIAAAAVASHNVKHAWVLAWVALRFAASSCALRFSHFAIVLVFSSTKFFTKAKS